MTDRGAQTPDGDTPDGDTPTGEPINDAGVWTEMEAGLREAWPELASMDPEDRPRSLDEAVAVIARMTGTSVDEVQRRIDEMRDR